MRRNFSLFLSSCSFWGLVTVTVAVHAQNADQTTKPKPARQARAAKQTPSYDASVPAPTLAGIRYGNHERHILDFWKASSDQPTPLVFVIHGGGWSGGSKERLHRFADPAALLKSGISVVAINYRLMAHTEGVVPPVKAPLEDAARALQFVRSIQPLPRTVCKNTGKRGSRSKFSSALKTIMYNI